MALYSKFVILKQSTCILLSFLMMTISLTEVITVTTFQASKTYIKENLCVNKAEVNNSCEGKCFLSKMFKTNKDSESPNPNSLNFEKSTYYLCEKPEIYISIESAPSERSIIENSNLYTHLHTPKLLQPPQPYLS